jgi:DNA polymerase-3 subunit delta'
MKFSDVIGNKTAIERIRHLVDSNRMPHALLLYGEPGIPKLALALATAQYIHCTNHRNGDSCGECDSCVQHQTFNHADTYFSFPYLKKNGDSSTCDDFITEWKKFLTENPVENYEKWLTLLKNDNSQPQIFVKESDNIIHKMSMASYSSRFKVLIMWLPEKLRPDCANKLLKIIEEPDPDSIFILVSNNSKEILPTILSRTQGIELKRPSAQEIAQYLTTRFGIDSQDALAIAGAADGDILLAEHDLELNSETKTFHKDFVKLMRLAYMRDLKDLKAWADGIAGYKREKTRRFLQYASRMIRENFVHNLKVPSLNYMTHDEEAFSAKFSPFINEANVEPMFEEFTRADGDIMQNANAKIVLFDLAIRITILIKP